MCLRSAADGVHIQQPGALALSAITSSTVVQGLILTCNIKVVCLLQWEDGVFAADRGVIYIIRGRL